MAGIRSVTRTGRQVIVTDEELAETRQAAKRPVRKAAAKAAKAPAKQAAGTTRGAKSGWAQAQITSRRSCRSRHRCSKVR
jgi:hypothetical protein